MKKTFPIFLFLYFVSSCSEKELHTINLPFEGQKLVIEGFFNPNDVMEVAVYSSLPPLGELYFDDTFHVVANATVLLFENGTLLEQLQYANDGIYRSPSGFKPTFRKAYHLEVTAPDFPKATSQPEVIPDSVPLFSWQFQDSLVVEKSSLKGLLTIHFSDIPHQDNYYHLGLKALYENEEYDFAYLDNGFQTIYPDCELEWSWSILNFKDVCFKNTTITMDFETQVRRIDDNFTPDLRFDKARLTLSTVSKSYYLYYKFLSVSWENDGNPFAQPVTYYTNIDGGYGVFSAYHERSILIDLR